MLVALVATTSSYASASAAVDGRVSERYQPLYRAAFDLAVLLLSGLGVSVVGRRL